jgi:hypothetical protein
MIMKATVAVMILVMAGDTIGYSQNTNWRALGEHPRDMIQFSFGYDFGATAQVGYSRSFTLIRPVLVGVDYSFPMGRDLFDDFKVRLGGQLELFTIGGFSTTLKILSSFRRYQTELVRIVSFGSDFGLVAGFYKPTWHAAGEFGFDKSITSHLKHSDVMRTYFPTIRDGWYIPTGGHYYYGVQIGKTLGESFDLTARLGATNAQFDDEDAILPYYAQLGLGIRF